MSTQNREIIPVVSGTFEPESHWYPRALSATLNPMVAFFLNMTQEQIVERYCHLHPNVNRAQLESHLHYKPKFFTHSGTDLIHATSEDGIREMIVIETNSSPSGQKSMPLLDDFAELGGYSQYAEKTFKHYLKSRRMIEGRLAVLYDKNFVEASGYAEAIAAAFDEEVLLVPYFNEEMAAELCKVEDGVIYVKQEDWVPVRACFRYVTQKPWNRIPVTTKTVVFNPVITCLAGGRNKLVASKAYQMFNAQNKEYNLNIVTPETIWDVQKAEIPLWVERMGGKAVVKVPYSNAGQGVYTIINQEELDRFMDIDFEYEKFIVQALIGNYGWSSEFLGGKSYHVGTVPNRKGKSFALDLRMIIHSTKDGYRPLSLYGRRASKALSAQLESGEESWDVLGTNLSIKEGDNQWTSDTNRLLLMDRKGFNALGIALDNLIDGFIQSVMATVAIDQMAIQLISKKGTLKQRLFKSLNNDDALLDEIYGNE